MTPAKQCSTETTAGQWAALVFCVAGGLFSAAITATFNISFGAQFGPDIAFVFAFVALMVAGLPLIANASGGWSLGLRAVWLLAVALSLTAAASHVLEIQANAFGKVAAGKAKAGNHAADEQRARANLDRITETSTVAALAAQVETAEGRLNGEEATATAAGIACEKRKACKAAQADLQALRERHGQAVARDSYKAELAALKTASKAAEPVKTIGMGDSIQTLTGADAEAVNALTSVAVWTGVLALLEMASAVFSALAGRIIAGIAAARRLRRLAQAKAAKAEADPVPAEPVSIAPTKRDETLLRLQVMIYQAEGERLFLSGNAIADKLGVNRTTFRTWCQKWKRDGLIWTEGKGKKSAFCTVHRAAA